MSVAEATKSLTELRESLKERGEKLSELRGLKPEDRKETWESDVRETIREIHIYDAEAQVAERLEEKPKGPQAAFDVPMEQRSLGEQVTESDGYRNRQEGQHFRAEGIDFRNLLVSGSEAPGAGFFAPVSPRIPPKPRQQRLWVRDLLSVQGTSFNSVPIIQELDAQANEGGASAVAEASAKPEVTLEMQLVNVPIEVVAGWLQASRQILEDAQTLQGYINTRLLYMLELRLQQQVLYGNGTPPQLQGITTRTGVQAAGPATTAIESLAAGMADVENVDGEADGIVMNPADFWTMVSSRHTTQFDGDGAVLGAGVPYAGPPNIVWGVPVVRSRAVTAGTAIVGAFEMGATLFVRSEGTIRTSDSHASTFISNIITILAELRAGLGVHRPDFFSEVDLLA